MRIKSLGDLTNRKITDALDHIEINGSNVEIVGKIQEGHTDTHIRIQFSYTHKNNSDGNINNNSLNDPKPINDPDPIIIGELILNQEKSGRIRGTRNPSIKKNNSIEEYRKQRKILKECFDAISGLLLEMFNSGGGSRKRKSRKSRKSKKTRKTKRSRK